jgi:hypothetical protein
MQSEIPCGGKLRFPPKGGDLGTRMTPFPSSLPPPSPLSPPFTPPTQSGFFSDDDLRGMFSLFDPVGSGSISSEQMRTALRNLGMRDLSGVPAEAGPKGIDQATFIRIARSALDKERVL